MTLRRPTQMRRRMVTEAQRVLLPEPGAGLRRVSITAASGNAPRCAIGLFPYVPIPGDDPTVDDAGAFNRLDVPPSANAVGAQEGTGDLVEAGSDNDYGRAGRAYLMPLFEVNMLDVCFEITEDQYIEAMSDPTGHTVLVITVEYP